jgi:hypothetical protein
MVVRPVELNGYAYSRPRAAPRTTYIASVLCRAADPGGTSGQPVGEQDRKSMSKLGRQIRTQSSSGTNPTLFDLIPNVSPEQSH